MKKSEGQKIQEGEIYDTLNSRAKQLHHCLHPCKQSFRTEIVACPFYASKRTDRAENMS